MPGTHFAVATLFDHPASGLLVTENHSTLAGAFTDFGATLRFSFTTDSDVRTAMIRSEDGAPLLESTLADGIETTTYLGRLTIFGRPRDPDPRVVGDKLAMADFASRPETQIIQAMRDALEARNISRDLYAAAKPANGTSWQAANLSPGESIAISTWSWWWPVAIDVWSRSGPARFQINDGRSKMTHTLNGWRRCAKPWAGRTVTVTNLYSTETLGVDGTLL